MPRFEHVGDDGDFEAETWDDGSDEFEADNGQGDQEHERKPWWMIVLAFLVVLTLVGGYLLAIP